MKPLPPRNLRKKSKPDHPPPFPPPKGNPMSWSFTITADNHEDAMRTFKMKAYEFDAVPAPFALTEAAQGLLWSVRTDVQITLSSSGHFDAEGRGSATVTVGTVLAKPAAGA